MASDSGCSSSSKRSTKFDDGFNKIDSLSDSDSSMQDCTTNGKRMKKDDSGINVIQENDVCNASSCDEGLCKDSSKINFCPVSGSDCNNVDSSNLEFCSVPELDQGCAAEMIVETEPINSESASPIEHIPEGSNMEVEHEPVILTDEETVSKPGKGDKKAENDKKFDPTPKTPRPKPNWIAPSLITSRQYGFSSKYSSDLFRYKCSGSLHFVERLELMYKMIKHDGCVNALNFNSTGTKLVSGSDDLIVIVWDWTLNEPLLEYRSGHSTNVFQAKFVPLTNDCFIVTCARDGQVRLGEVSSEGVSKGTRKLAQHKGAAHRLAVQVNSPHNILTCGEDAAVFNIDLRKEKPDKLFLCKNKNKKVPLYSIFINPSKPYEFAVGGRCQYAKIYDNRFINQKDGFVKEYCPEHLVNDEKVNITSLVYNYNGQEILASFNDDDIYLFDTKQTNTFSYQHRYQGHRNNQTVKGVNYFGAKSEFIMSGSDCGYIFFWEKESEHIVKFMYGDEGGAVNCLEPHPTMPVLATSGLDDDIKIWVPSCEHMPDLTNLKSHIIRNMKERDEDRTRENPDEYLDQTLWLLMQHLSRARRMPYESDTDSNSSASEDAEDNSVTVARCNQS